MNQTDFDIVIVGAGFVGASLALALAKAPLRIALVEAAPVQAVPAPQSDGRSITLSFGSQRIFATLDLWSALAPGATPIRKIHMSERGKFGSSEIDSAEEAVDALGYVVSGAALGQTLHAALMCYSNVHWFRPAHLAGVHMETDAAHVTLRAQELPRALTTRLIVGADGADSQLRSLLGIQHSARDYRQSAIVTTLMAERFHDYTAYERFTAHGPIAVLPLEGKRCGVVWMTSTQDAALLAALPDAQFLDRLHDEFGNRLGAFSNLTTRHRYPLQLIRAAEQIRTRAVLIGNAVNTLHPIGAQGFNLGLRDAAALAQTLVDAQRAGQDIGALSTLQTYEKWRKPDQRSAILFTDVLARVAAISFKPVRFIRHAGLLAGTALPPLKHRMARQALGLEGHLPKLARGLAL